MRPPSLLAARDVFVQLNASQDWAAIYRFGSGTVQMEVKRNSVELSSIKSIRADHYLAFFSSVATILPANFQAEVCLSLADTLHMNFNTPTLAFQKQDSASSLLIPDIDFLYMTSFSVRSGSD